MTSLRTLTLAAILVMATAPVLAADAGKHDMNMSGMKMEGMMGMHEMSATVDAIDSKTGLVDVNAGGMKLKLHFPSSALANVKAGDKITLHLAFTKP